MLNTDRPTFTRLTQACVLLFTAALTASVHAAAPAETGEVAGAFTSKVQPLVKKYCVSCHSTETKKGSLDLERFSSVIHVRKDVKPWQSMIEMLESGEMPPKKKPQPTPEERKLMIDWIHGFLNAEAIARAGDPGFVPIRRLSNAEYDYTIRDLTSVDLRPAREFPADGAGGEGFTNAAESLADMSPTLLNKYLLAAKDVASHVVLLPDGFRFSAGKTRRDWADESVAHMRAFYAQFANEEGVIAVQPYVRATIRHRDALKSGKITVDKIATDEKLNPKYLGILWKTLSSDVSSYPLDSIRARWKQATEKDADAIASDIAAWQERLWKVVNIGSYREGAASRQSPNDSLVSETQTIRLSLKPIAGKNEVVLYLNTRDLFPAAGAGSVIWGRPRLEAPNKPVVLLRDYPKVGPAYELDLATVFADSAKYLAAVVDAVNDRKKPIDEVAKANGLDAARLKRWMEVVAIEPYDKSGSELGSLARSVPRVDLELLTELDKNPNRPAINGFHKKGTDLPVVVSNSSDAEEHIPGRASAHKVVVHPSPSEFVGIAWKSPFDGRVRITGNVEHVHGGCGNGVAWFLEHRTADSAGIFAEAILGVNAQSPVPARFVKVAKGDTLLLGVDAKVDHGCDLTQVTLTIADAAKPERKWDLSSDVANDILEGNPHADKQGNKDVWSFVKGPSRVITAAGAQTIPPESILGKWRIAASDPARREETAKLAQQVQSLLSGAHPPKEQPADAALYDSVVSGDGPLLHGLELSSLNKGKTSATHFGVDASVKFGIDAAGKPIDDASIAAAANSVIEVRLPSSLASGKEFVVECRLAAPADDRAAQFEVRTTPAAPTEPLGGSAPVVATTNSAAQKKLVQGLNEFRDCFPKFTCYPHVLPVDEVVCLKMFHREDEPLIRLFLSDEQRKQIDHLWEEHRFIGQQPLAENKYLPLFIGFVTQDQPKELLQYFEGQRPAFKKRSDDFEKDWEAAAPKQLRALAEFTAKAFRRPLQEQEKSDLQGLYRALRAKGVSHEDAFNGVLARVLVSPSFLFKLEVPPASKEAGAISDWELATRLSYFLWSSLPDDELLQAAATGKLRDPNILAEQTKRMLKDARVRSLGIEFGTQWIHVRGFDAFNEKSEKLYPGFDEKLRAAIYEESILFFADLFQTDQPVNHILDANYTFLNDLLAKHYNIPNITGSQWRRVEDVRKYGRGGILALASVQAKQAGAARTSPVLRGNWVVETLLGEKLPRPPADVPKLPEEEGTDNLTMRQLVEKHTKIESCAVCHVRMDPLGFSFERYDAIGRLRDKESTGLAIDAHAKLKDGTEFEGLDGLRNYLLTKKKDVIVRLFCKRLLGYALGRGVSLSDQGLVDQMVTALNQNEGKLSAAVQEIVKSPQFQKIRGSQFVEGEE